MQGIVYGLDVSRVLRKSERQFIVQQTEKYYRSITDRSVK